MKTDLYNFQLINKKSPNGSKDKKKPSNKLLPNFVFSNRTNRAKSAIFCSFFVK